MESLKEDLQDVTESHNLKVIQLKETFEQMKQDETREIVAKYEAQINDFDRKLAQEAADAAF